MKKEKPVYRVIGAYDSETTNYNQDWNYLSGSTRVTLYECEPNGSVDGYYITDGTNYLTISGVAPNAVIINTTSKSDAAIWRFSNGANGGTAYTVVGGYMYYLCLANNALTIYSVENSTAKTSWSVSNNGISSGGSYIDYKNNIETNKLGSIEPDTTIYLCIPHS